MKKNGYPMGSKLGKVKPAKMKEELDMDGLCDMSNLDEIEDEMDMCALEQEDYGNSAGPIKQMNNNGCDNFPDCIMLAHSYVPWQTYEQAFTPPEALMKGTLFPELWGVYKIPK